MRRAVLVSIAVLMVTTNVGCGDPRVENVTDSSPTATTHLGSGRAAAVAVQYIVENPHAYAGREVMVTGQVVDIWSPRVFTVVGQQFLGNPALLVVAQRPVSAFRGEVIGGATPHGLAIRISGVVRTDTLAAIERDFAIELAPAVQSLGQVDRPVLVAARIVLSDRRDQLERP